MTAEGKTGLVFGPAQAEDLEALVRMDASAPQPWDATAFRGELEREPGGLWVMRTEGQPVAFAVIRILGPEMDVVNFAVAAPHRGLGIGGRFLRNLLEHAASQGVRSAFLEVRESNRAARALYARTGFKEVRRRPAFYQNPPEDGLVLRLEMASGSG